VDQFSKPCAVTKCERVVGPKGAKGYCPLHYTRNLRWGSPLGKPCATCGSLYEPRGQELYCAPRCIPECSVDGCKNASHTKTWCKSHYAQWRRTGLVKPFGYKWAAAGGLCVVCGSAVKAGAGRRKHCSGRCQAMDSRHEGKRPQEASCVKCGASINFLEITRRGQFRRTDAKLCRSCRVDCRWAMTADELAERDGTDCGICGDPVDMSLVHPNMMRKSVDHILARANGGLDIPENLALTHLWCNCAKSNRTVTSAMRM
jgi:hypothetical protein